MRKYTLNKYNHEGSSPPQWYILYCDYYSRLGYRMSQYFLLHLELRPNYITSSNNLQVQQRSYQQTTRHATFQLRQQLTVPTLHSIVQNLEQATVSYQH